MKENIGKFIVPFDEHHNVLEIQELYYQDFTKITYYQCKYVNNSYRRSFGVTSEMESYAIFDSLQEANKIARLTVRELLIDCIRSNKTIERLCKKIVVLKGFDPTESPSAAAAEEDVYGNDCPNGSCS